ncbi:hypothetical protein [Sphingobium sp. WCS2017Hpa-17]|uniref:hypothetical protein n=1 Tax=Sphingobium sp. WCS2017Hpa-17 TaxID=3073638 RepID=UPI00288AFA13|nr:hypothetical protein [Sphingobium sp. WCS2017Hpa-17]
MHDLVMQAAWTAGVIGRAKKVPPLKNFMISPASTPKRQSWQAMYVAATAWASERGSIVEEGGAA